MCHVSNKMAKLNSKEVEENEVMMKKEVDDKKNYKYRCTEAKQRKNRKEKKTKKQRRE